MLIAATFIPPGIFAYDGQRQATGAYDGSGESLVLGYEVGSRLPRGEMENGIAGDRVLFFNFAVLAANRAPIFADNNVLVSAFRGNANALAEIRAGTTYVTPNQFREFLNVNEVRR